MLSVKLKDGMLFIVTSAKENILHDRPNNSGKRRTIYRISLNILTLKVSEDQIKTGYIRR